MTLQHVLLFSAGVVSVPIVTGVITNAIFNNRMFAIIAALISVAVFVKIAA